MASISDHYISFFLSMRRYRVSHNALPKKITRKYSNNYYFVSLKIYGIPYIKKTRNSVKFRGFSRNYMTRNSGEFRRNFSQFRTEYGIDGSKKTGGIPCRRNSVDTLGMHKVSIITGNSSPPPSQFIMNLITELNENCQAGLDPDPNLSHGKVLAST